MPRVRIVVVSIHAPTGGATLAQCPRGQIRACFNSRAHGGRDIISRFIICLSSCFNSRAHGGRDTYWAELYRLHRKFQFTRPRGARHVKRANGQTVQISFNSRAHGGRDTGPPRGPRGGRMVSIHAPTGGATLPYSTVQYGTVRSIHAPTGGATPPLRLFCLIRHSYVQFTRPRGARRTAYLALPGMDRVSIHAPTGGATLADRRGRLVCDGFNSRAHGGRDRHWQILSPSGDCFNSRAHGGRDVVMRFHAYILAFQFTRPRGARQPSISACAEQVMFQFTRPRGARLAQCPRGQIRARFNSRAHGGRDVGGGSRRPPEKVSIHAPTGGATSTALERGYISRVSIHAPTGGATKSTPNADARTRFNSRAHGGRDLALNQRTQNRRRFNSRAHGGRDPACGLNA